MLCQFSFKNFKSYKEITTFDFQATSIPEFSESLLMSEKADALLPVGVIYGPNGGGKTNLLLALSCLISTVVNPIYELEKAREKVIIQQKVSAAPFYFDEISKEMPTEFEVYFRQGKMNTGTICRYAVMKSLKKPCIGRQLEEKEQVWFLIVKVQKSHWERALIRRALTVL